MPDTQTIAVVTALLLAFLAGAMYEAVRRGGSADLRTYARQLEDQVEDLRERTGVLQ